MRKLFSTSLLLVYISTMVPIIFAEDLMNFSLLDSSLLTEEISAVGELESAPISHRYTSTNPMECLLTKWMIEGSGTISLDRLNRYHNDMSLACMDETVLNSASETGRVEDEFSLTEGNIGDSTTTPIPSVEFICGDDIMYGEFIYSTTTMPDDSCWTTTSMMHLSGTGDSWNYGDTTANLPTNETGSSLGRLYTWRAAMGIPEDSTGTGETSSGVCALLGDGWTLPTNNDWSMLEISGATGWMGNQFLGLASSLPGIRTEDGTFNFQGEFGFWWTQSSDTLKTASTRSVNNSDYIIYSNDYKVKSGLSVHCIKK